MSERTLTADTAALAAATADTAATVRLIQSAAAKKQALAANVVSLMQAANYAAIKTLLDLATGQIGAIATDTVAASGKVGELKTSEIAVGSAVSLTTGTISNIATLSLEAGRWEIWGAIKFNGNAATTVSSLIGSISSLNNSVTSGLAAQGSTHRVAYNSFTLFNAIAAGSQIMPIAPAILHLASTTSYYLNARADFATNSCAAWGDLYAIRH